jgi:hypothetical protein
MKKKFIQNKSKKKLVGKNSTNKKYSEKKSKNKNFKEIDISVFGIFTESFKLLLKEPKLFLPKTIIAILYGIAIYFQAQILLELTTILASNNPVDYIPRLNELLIIMLILLGYNILIYIADIFATSLYPTMIKQLETGKVSLREAIKNSKKHFFTMFVSSTIPLILLTIITIPFSFIILINQEMSLILNIFSVFVIGYIFVMLFYFLYPVVILGKKNSLNSIKQTIQLSLLHKKKVFLLSSVPFFVTILKTITAFLAEDPAFLFIFIVLVLLTGIVYTYHMVINPYFYLKIK